MHLRGRRVGSRRRAGGRRTAALGLGALLVAGCSHDGRTLAPAGPDQTASIVTTTVGEEVIDASSFVLVGPWSDGDPIDAQYTCDGGAGRPPAFNWEGLPIGTLELALSLIDLDDLHRIVWLVGGIDPTVGTSVGGGFLPPGAVELRGTSGLAGYDLICPPAGDPPHRYQATLYALGEPLGLGPELPGEEALSIITNAAVATATLAGTYVR